MKLAVILDENISPQLCDYIRMRRPFWDVRHVQDVALSGASDQVIFEWAQHNRAIVITFDEDFADTRMYPAGTHAGVIRLRVWPTTIEQTEAALDRLLSFVQDESLVGSLVIIDEQRIRIRRGARHG